ncbi:MAG: hypothetical protein ACREI3_12515, partial [Nitrospirales bacterium]
MIGEKGYLERYAKFFRRREGAKGHDFHRGPLGSAPTPTVSFSQRLRWWTWDRWRRRKKIRQERDRYQQDILRLREPPPSTEPGLPRHSQLKG